MYVAAATAPFAAIIGVVLFVRRAVLLLRKSHCYSCCYVLLVLLFPSLLDRNIKPAVSISIRIMPVVTHETVS